MNERIVHTKALEWILMEVYKHNKQEKVVNYWIHTGDFQGIIQTYNKVFDEGIRKYSVEEATMYAQDETLVYMNRLVDKKREVADKL